MNGKVLIGVVAVVAVVAVAAAAIALGGGDKDDNVTITEGVLYYPNGGTGEKDHYELSMSEVSKNSWFTYPDKVFVSWNTKADGTGTTYMPGDHIDYGHKTVKLYAQWGEKTQYSASFTHISHSTIGMELKLNGSTPVAFGFNTVYKTTGNIIEITVADYCSGFVWDDVEKCFKFKADYPNGKSADVTITVKMTNAADVAYGVEGNTMVVGFKAVGDMTIDIASHIVR